MDLPSAIRDAVDDALQGVPLADLQRASERLTKRYRGEVRDGRLHLSDDISARAYLAVRMPATYAAIRASFAAVAQLQPGFTPRTLLDIGSGPGTAAIAARHCWESLVEAELIEASPAIRPWGERLVSSLELQRVAWGDQASMSTAAERTFDLVTLGYLLDELPSASVPPLIARSWQATAGTMVVIEPGTPAGWQRILAVRAQLLDAGANLVAPCPHAQTCPVSPPDWCHFSRRVQRSRMHRRIKSADVPWEDEKFIYLAVARNTATRPQARVIANPSVRGGTVSLTLCNRDGTRTQSLLSKRDGKRFAQARRLDWGDALMPASEAEGSGTA